MSDNIVNLSEVFFDTNVILYLQSHDEEKRQIALQKLRHGGNISVQILNEIFNVTRKKLKLSDESVDELLNLIGEICDIHPLTIETHKLGVDLARRFNFSTYDAMVVASALWANCSILYSEDMQHGLIVDKQLTIINPFKLLDSSF